MPSLAVQVMTGVFKCRCSPGLPFFLSFSPAPLHVSPFISLPSLLNCLANNSARRKTNIFFFSGYCSVWVAVTVLIINHLFFFLLHLIFFNLLDSSWTFSSLFSLIFSVTHRHLWCWPCLKTMFACLFSILRSFSQKANFHYVKKHKVPTASFVFLYTNKKLRQKCYLISDRLRKKIP